ncbi:hypothetical protein LCGC14_3159750, partial [marine sediment metagenome]
MPSDEILTEKERIDLGKELADRACSW